MGPLRRTLRRPPARAQRGVVLMVALIVLVALTLAGLSMIRSTDTGVIVAGNLSFRQAAAQALDTGIEAAIAGLPADLGFSNTPIPDKYFPVPLATEASTGLPTGVNWSAGYQVSSAQVPAGYTVNYIVERLCTNGMPATVDPSDLHLWCNVEKGADFKSSKLDGTDYGQLRKMHYNVTVRVQGPRNTETFAQAVVSR